MNYASKEIKDLPEERVIILPVGSCEQHGTHLPVGTDTFIGEHILKTIVKIVDNNVLVLPYIWFGFSQHHMDFRGSLTVSNETLIRLIVELCESIYKNNFRKIILFNSHGGNIPALQVAVNEIGVRNNRGPVLLSYWNCLKRDIEGIRKSRLGGIGHAGELETSLAMYLFSEYVQESNDASYISNPYYTHDMFSSNLYYKYGKLSSVSSKGLVGDPGLASADEGKQLFDLIIANLREFILYFQENEL